MFSRTLTWVETGIADWSDDQRVSQYTKGSKLLGPQDKIKSIKSIEVSLRNNLEKYTFRVTGFSPYRWLPFTAYSEWRERHDVLVAKLAEVKRWLVDNRETWYDQLAVEFTNIAESVWTSLTAGKNTKDRTTQVYKFVRVNVDGTMQDLDHEKFVSYFVSNTMRQVPTAGQIEQKLGADYVTALVYGSQDIEEDAAAAQGIRENVRLLRQRNEMENSIVEERMRKEAWLNQQDQAEREVKLQAMYDMEAAHARKQLTELASPFEEVFNTMRQQFAEDAADMLESVKKNGFVRGKVKERGRGLIEMYDLMAIHDDGDLRRKLVELKSMLGPASENEVDVDKVKATLEAITEFATETSRRLSKRRGSASQLSTSNKNDAGSTSTAEPAKDDEP